MPWTTLSDGQYGAWEVETSEGEMASGGGRMRGSILTIGAMRQEGIYTHQCVCGGGIHTPWWEQERGSALTIGSFPTHVTLHEGDDPNAGCQEAISKPGEEGLEGRGGWERISTSETLPPKCLSPDSQTEGPVIPRPHPAPNPHHVLASPPLRPPQ